MEYLKESGYSKGEEFEVWEADKKEWKHKDFTNVNGLIEDIQYYAITL